MGKITVFEFDAVVVGTGAAGYNAACRIKQEGKKAVAMITEGVNMGTSRNTGSDKQTYYKLGLGGDSPDSVRQMARDLFAGGAADGDNALCEAALSTRCFLNLCEAGVPFPTNRYGEYIGYKTDHDPYARATSAGPLTSHFMTNALQKKAEALNIPVFDRLYAAKILKDQNGVCGIACINKDSGDMCFFRCAYIVLATGGPAGIYADSVYPACHTGSSSLAFCAGAGFQNMTEWQFGLASTSPRWNVSGTYMQVLPRFVSVDEDGAEREFLSDFFADPYDALSAVFMKGYQWPFDSAKVLSGSSVIDLLVYHQTVNLRRRVYLDYTANPFGLEEIDFAKLSEEAYTYLTRAGACFGTPIERLRHMNAPAIELYASKGVDITKDMLPIALCAQHNNGGIAVDMWWQTCVPGLYAAGECAGTHGISRPGGSALNSGQVGSLRCAQHISASAREKCPDGEFEAAAQAALEEHRQLMDAVLGDTSNIDGLTGAARRLMSDRGGAIRVSENIISAAAEVKQALSSLRSAVKITDKTDIYKVYTYRDGLITQLVCLESMADFERTAGATRGSALYCSSSGQKREGLDECFRFVCRPKVCADRVQYGYFDGKDCTVGWRQVRPIPEGEDFFENIWRGYRENKNIF